MLDQPKSDFFQIPVNCKSALLDSMCKLKSGEYNGLVVLTVFKHYVIYLHNKNNSEKLG